MLALATVHLVAQGAGGFPAADPHAMDYPMVFGFLMSFVTLVFFIEQQKSSARGLWLALCLAGMAMYGFLEGAWAMGFLVSMWSGATVRQWRRRIGRRPGKWGAWHASMGEQANNWASESRIDRLFGRN